MYVCMANCAFAGKVSGCLLLATHGLGIFQSSFRSRINATLPCAACSLAHKLTYTLLLPQPNCFAFNQPAERLPTHSHFST